MVPIFTFCLMRNNLGKWLLFVFSIVQSNSTQNFDSATLSYLLHFEPMVLSPLRWGTCTMINQNHYKTSDDLQKGLDPQGIKFVTSNLKFQRLDQIEEMLPD